MLYFIQYYVHTAQLDDLIIVAVTFCTASRNFRLLLLLCGKVLDVEKLNV